MRVASAAIRFGAPFVATMLPAQDPLPQHPPHAASPTSIPDLSLDVHLNILAAVGTSTERDDVLLDLKGGSHDPRQRGFTLQQVELSIAGAVDRWFDAKASVVAAIDPEEGETVVELEDAYLTTRQLPLELQLKAGYYLTSFGIVNTQHPHAWDWMDQPVALTRILGGDGMRGAGAMLAWSPAAAGDTGLSVGVQNADGETMASFLANEEVYEERPPGGRLFDADDVRSMDDLVWSARAATSIALVGESQLGLGASVAFGPNATGGDTSIFGLDFLLRWPAADCPWARSGIEVQGEWLGRRFFAEPQVDARDPLNPFAIPGDTLRDQGAYVQFLWHLAEQWSAGLRGEYATGSGLVYDADAVALAGRETDPFAADRIRVSPLLCWAPSPSSRVRLQYDYDDSDHLSDAAHSVWLGFEVTIGAHPPHRH